ncbi:MAG: hypothetical protein HDQ98_00305 [Lachnospiraceae bacterium]|nr:hypothetical protein [Lachnospiraceae bacterium]
MKKIFSVIFLVCLVIGIMWCGRGEAEQNRTGALQNGQSGEEQIGQEEVLESELVGAECILLNDNTMIVGTWGKLLLAHRIDEEVNGFSLSDLGKASDFIDYEFIQENHEILEYDICTSPRYDYADTILAEYLWETVEEAELLRELGVSNPITIDYFTYDLNADGLEDYIVCESGVYCTGSAGDELEIYVQEEEGTLRKIFGLTIPLHLPEISGLPGGHAPIAVLNEKVNGYYVLVLPENCDIVKYDADRECYDFEFLISDLGKAADFIDYESLIPELRGIRKYNICTRPRDDYADTILAEYLREELEEAGRVAGSSDPVIIDYFLYDFNDDGLEDYLVCMSGALWSDENDGNEVRIYVQEGETVRMVFSGTVPLHLPDIPGLRGGHAPIAVLSGRINDYHMLVLPGNRILKYDSDSDCYQYDYLEF